MSELYHLGDGYKTLASRYVCYNMGHTMSERASDDVKKALLSFVDEFQSIRALGKRVRTIFWMNFDPYYRGTDFYKHISKGGKRTPEEIRSEIIRLAKSQKFDFSSASGYERKLFLMENGLGVDCSGFGYQCLRLVYETLGGKNFEEKVCGENGQNGITKVGVQDFVSSRNSIPIKNLKMVKPGDFIIREGKHMVVIINSMGNKLDCVHASNEIETPGIHRFKIIIRGFSLPIFQQEWQEFGLGGLPYYIDIDKKIKQSDGIRRLKIIDSLYRKNSH